MADKQTQTTEKQTKKGYDPQAIEQESYNFWIDGGYYHAEPDAPGQPYCIVIPPPNVTDRLHLGHGLNNTIQDILTRWRRMAGDNTCWIPGTDHAGIATQTVVEKRVLAEQGKKRTQFAREEFVAIIQKWKDEYEQTILGQLKAMGSSCDWDRTRFTMDPICARAVREAFFRLFKDGLIYRGKRLVNWDPATQTALADDEVEMEEIDGHFWYMRYPLVEPVEFNGQKIEYVTVATTRPETMLGDTAVAMNPADPRIAALKGKMVRLPIVNRVVPIIADEYVVLPNPESDDAKAKYASGFLKVTPAHDPNDYDIGRRHNLPLVNILAPDGSISEKHGWPEEDYKAGDAFLVTLFGKDRFEARKMVVGFFKENGLLEEVKPYRHSVGHSYRSHVPIEPYLSDQWYCKVTDERLAGRALRALAKDQRAESVSPYLTGKHETKDWEGQLRFTPERYAKTFQMWHENLRDWCISRQLWWGHRIPVWRTEIELTRDNFHEHYEQLFAQAGLNHVIDGEYPNGVVRVYATETGESVDPRVLSSRPKEDAKYTIYVCYRNPEEDENVKLIESVGFTRDPDVLDTWFSSALWPISTLGWPDPSAFPDIFPQGDLALSTWNPSSTLSTAREIITLWVSRMVMFNLYFRDCLPFKDVFIHAMIQDGEGRKMSKSLGNGVDPLDIIHSHGADAMRFTLASMTTQTQDVRMPVEKDPATGRNTSPKFDNGRNFSNKIWQASTGLAIPNLEGYDPQPLAYDSLPLEDRWILSRLQTAIQTIDKALTGFQFADASQECYRFFWNELCDWYLEMVKPRLRGEPAVKRVAQQMLAWVLDQSLRLLHPFMPFLTEALWKRLNEAAPQRGIEQVCEQGEALIRAAWPKVNTGWQSVGVETQMARLQEIIRAVRDAVTRVNERRAGQKQPVLRNLPLTVIRTDAELAGLLDQQRETFMRLGRTEQVQYGTDVAKPAGSMSFVVAGTEVFVPVADLIDSDVEKKRLAEEIDKAEKMLAGVNAKLADEKFTGKAPAHVVQVQRDRQKTLAEQIETLKQHLAELGKE
jgi:valyl-tRNA synthetase